MRLKVLIAGVLAVVVVASLWYVQAPPRSEGDYRHRAAATAEKLSSHVQTAGLWVQAERRGKATRQAATVGIQEAEHDANKAASKFASHDPPVGATEVRADLTAASSEATTALADLRIAAHREDWPAVSAAAERLPGLASRLKEVARRAHR